MTETEWLTSNDPGAMLRTVRREHETGQSSVARVSDRKLRLFACACCRAMLGRWVPYSDDMASLVVTAEQVADGLAGSRERGLAFNITDLIKGPKGTYARGCLRSDPAEGVREILAEPVDFEGEISAGYAALLRDIAGNPWRPVTLPHDPACRVCGGTGRFHVGSGEDAEIFECRCCPWLTPTVKSLAHAAYDERVKKCSDCVAGERQWGTACVTCGGTGHIDDGSLDPVRLAVLADALEEAGCPQEEACPRCDGKGEIRVGNRYDGPVVWPCPECRAWRQVPHPLLAHLRGPGPHVRGCFALDLILGKE